MITGNRVGYTPYDRELTGKNTNNNSNEYKKQPKSLSLHSLIEN